MHILNACDHSVREVIIRNMMTSQLATPLRLPSGEYVFWPYMNIT